jgi:CubicO group peptidase (beta-lactamase class C family)
MLGHLSGFGHYGATDYTNTTPYANVADVVPRLLAVPLVAPPGTRYAYSSYAFNVLGAALQIASGKEFRALVADEVTRPLAMTSTVAESPAVLKNRARLYSRGADNVLTSAAASDVTDRWPSGGFLSTAEDLVLFGMGFLQAGYLKTELRELAFTAQRLADGTETRVGLGWRIARDEDGRRYVHHGGDSIGGRAFLLVYPDAGVAVAILSNLSLASITEKDALALAHPFVTR